MEQSSFVELLLLRPSGAAVCCTGPKKCALSLHSRPAFSTARQYHNAIASPTQAASSSPNVTVFISHPSSEHLATLINSFYPWHLQCRLSMRQILTVMPAFHCGGIFYVMLSSTLREETVGGRITITLDFQPRRWGRVVVIACCLNLTPLYKTDL